MIIIFLAPMIFSLLAKGKFFHTLSLTSLLLIETRILKSFLSLFSTLSPPSATTRKIYFLQTPISLSLSLRHTHTLLRTSLTAKASPLHSIIISSPFSHIVQSLKLLNKGFTFILGWFKRDRQVMYPPRHLGLRRE